MLIPMLLLITHSLSYYSDIDPSNCTNYYSPQQPPDQCNQNTCYFDLGISALLSNKTLELKFVLCIDLPGYNIYVNHNNPNETFMEDIESVYIFSNTLQFLNSYTLICTQNLVLITQNYSYFSGTVLTGSKIWVYSQGKIQFHSSIFINESVIQTQCTCSKQNKASKQCGFNFVYPQIFTNNIFNISNMQNQLKYQQTPNNSITVISEQNVLMVNTLFRYSIIGIFSVQLELQNSTLSTFGLGYPSDSGPGCGYFDQVLNQLLGCMGSGGSHGGFGGNSSPQNCYLLVSKTPYGSIEFPSQPGSGGGFFLPQSRQSSSGGGIINIQALTIISSNSTITSQGKNGIQGGGGGSGGTISFDYNYTNTTATNISVNGGNGDKMSSSGSGGRIRLWNHNWQAQTILNSSTNLLQISASGGNGCNQGILGLSCGENGSIFTSPCKPGSELAFPSYICTKCVPGQYQLTFGYSFCISCNKLPANATWNVQNFSQNVYDVLPCSFSCNQGLENYAGKCMTKTQKIFKSIYAANLLISAGIIGAAILIYFLIRFFKRLAQKQHIIFFDDPNMNETYRKKFFRLEDLPYHEARLYCEGFNHPFKPWKISIQSENNFYSEMKSPVSKINHIITKVIKEINTKAQFSRWQKIVLIFFRYAYYPCSRLILSSMRKAKARIIFDEVDKFNKKIPQAECLGIKFHVKPQCTVASLEIFNYNKSVLDFYIENYFPLYFILERSPFGGYVIDFADPFLKVFINELIQKQTTGRSVETFLQEVNKYLKNQTQVVSCLNYLYSLSDISPKFQAYLWQPPDRTIGIVDKDYKINKDKPLFLVIGSQNLNNGHFLLQQTLPSIYLPEIQCLKHKFITRKDSASEIQGSTIWILQNQVNERVLIWIYGFFSVITLLLTLSSFFLIILIKKIPADTCENPDLSKSTIFVIYFAFWPLCDFIGVFLNFKSIFSKNEYVLANAITFTIVTSIKSLILFLILQIYNIEAAENCLESNMYIWLVMTLIGVIVFILQIMLRARIIALAK